MTQEEIRNFLTEKKVFVNNKSKEIQLKLFELGFKWYDYPTQEPKHLNKPFLFIDKLQKLSYGSHTGFFYKHSYEEISAEDILNIKVEHLPKTWEEFCKNNPVTAGEATLNSCNGAVVSLPAKNTRHSILDKCFLPSISAAKAHRALIQLHQLRDCYRGNTISMYWYSIIRKDESNLIVQDNNRFLSFPTRELAKEFLKNFKDIIIQAGDFI